ncbi:hypothetical protein PGSY75_0003600E, partial [Plasmodium gaboni]
KKKNNNKYFINFMNKIRPDKYQDISYILYINKKKKKLKINKMKKKNKRNKEKLKKYPFSYIMNTKKKKNKYVISNNNMLDKIINSFDSLQIKLKNIFFFFYTSNMNMYIGIFIRNIKSLLLNNHIYNKTNCHHLKYIQQINKCIIFTRDNYLNHEKIQLSIFEIFNNNNTLNDKKNKCIYYLSPLFFFLNKYHNKKKGLTNKIRKHNTYEYKDNHKGINKHAFIHTKKKFAHAYDMIYFDEEHIRRYTNINKDKEKIRKKQKNMCLFKKGTSIYSFKDINKSLSDNLHLSYYNKKKKKKIISHRNNYKSWTFFDCLYKMKQNIYKNFYSTIESNKLKFFKIHRGNEKKVYFYSPYNIYLRNNTTNYMNIKNHDEKKLNERTYISFLEKKKNKKEMVIDIKYYKKINSQNGKIKNKVKRKKKKKKYIYIKQNNIDSSGYNNVNVCMSYESSIHLSFKHTFQNINIYIPLYLIVEINKLLKASKIIQLLNSKLLNFKLLNFFQNIKKKKKFQDDNDIQICNKNHVVNCQNNINKNKMTQKLLITYNFKLFFVDSKIHFLSPSIFFIYNVKEKDENINKMNIFDNKIRISKVQNKIYTDNSNGHIFKKPIQSNDIYMYELKKDKENKKIDKKNKKYQSSCEGSTTLYNSYLKKAEEKKKKYIDKKRKKKKNVYLLLKRKREQYNEENLNKKIFLYDIFLSANFKVDIKKMRGKKKYIYEDNKDKMEIIYNMDDIKNLENNINDNNNNN